ncbi:putative cral trio domain-containing protein [Zalerion maritima]|uniref:Cral trio domain-containing protein n=1 Tax=Zalerion maritima TaxID=339359 RepID=A0AAD5RUX2_9PEZI|nr:putative cral trio domain-containing protein [Zalerion maritima]
MALKTTETPAAASSSASTAENSPGPLKTPPLLPISGCKPQDPVPLTADEQKKYDWLLAQARGWKEVPSKVEGKSGPLTDDEKFWLSRECIIRFLRATKMHEKDSEKRLLETLAWRREYGVDENLTPEHISPENETGKQIMAGFDKQGRPCHYLNPARQNTDPSPRQIQHLVYMVERVLDLMPPHQETLTLLINFKPGKNRGNTAPGINIGRECLHILQMHYPERLGRALIINGKPYFHHLAPYTDFFVNDLTYHPTFAVPWVVWGFFKLITPFIDPRTREKLHFNEDMTQFVPKEQLWTEYPGGEMAFEYEHETYWPALWKLCQERRAARREKWVKGGKHIGEYEDFMTGYSERGCVTAAGLETKEEASKEETKT